MQRLSHTFFIICSLFFAFISCEKLEFPTDSKETQVNKPNEEIKKDSTSNSQNTNAPTELSIEDYVYEHLESQEPFSVNDILSIIPQFFQLISPTDTPASSISKVNTIGYIVGYVNGNNINKTVFGTEGSKESNIVIADTPNEQDYTKCIAVQLSTTSSYLNSRNALNLSAHPENLGKRVILYGKIEKYMGALGMKNILLYEFVE